MRFRTHLLAPLALALLAIGFHVGPTKSQAAVYADNLYYDQLDPYGDWYFVEDYGWCWSPGYVSAGWRPYTVGYWAYSDWGWVWVSEDPWGSWPYHYGRWALDASYGWIWVPGDIWAPAWVSWRYGSGWVGWAPLPPDVGWSIGIGISYSSSSLDRRILSSAWCFVPVNDFASRRIRGRVQPIGRNVTLIRNTRNVTRYVDVDARPFERGLRVDMIERDSGKRIPRFGISERPARGRGGVEVRGRTIQVSKPTRTTIRAANSKLRALPRERADRPARENANASRMRRERDAEVRSQRNAQQARERRAVQERSRRNQEQGSNQIQEQRSRQRQEERSQVQERRSRQRQEERSQIQERRSQERRSQAQERRPQQERPEVQERRARESQERRPDQAQERRSRQQERSQVQEERSRQGQERRSRQAQEQRRKQQEERERRGRGGGGT